MNFKKWVLLEDAKKELASSVEGVEFPEKVLDYLFTAYGKTKEGEWKNTVFSVVEAFKEFSIDTSLPLLQPSPKEKKGEDWEYPGRSWNFYSHILAKSYGWTLDYIAELDTLEALGHIQEILTGEQIDREFIYSLSEIAYPYNKTTKKGEFKPLTRPYWMRPISKPIKKIRIKRSMMPMGHVVDASGLGAELGGWNEIITEKTTKETNPPRNPQALPPPS